jgi:putative membrane protein
MEYKIKGRKYYVFILLFFVGFIGSGIHPHDYFTWILEVFPSILGFLILISTYKKFQFTFLTYTMILVHCYVLFVGGHYTYAEVPLFDWLKEFLNQTRNNYDKLGHFFQGFVPAMIVWEIFSKMHIVKKSGWMAFLTVCVCLSISVLYEFLEWFVAISSGQSADSFLGTQGDVWDTQSDMLFAMIGAICMLIIMKKLLNKQIENQNYKHSIESH